MSIFTMPEGETGGRLIGRSLGAGLGQGVSQGITARLNDMFKKKEMLKRESEFLEKGFPPQLAALASVATIGGQTEIYKSLLDEFKRGEHPKSKQLAELQAGQEERQPQEMAPEQEEMQTQPSRQQEVIESSDIGLTPAEKVKSELARYKTQFKPYEELVKKVSTLNQDNIKLNRLEVLNESGKLPKGLELLNVTSEGNLRLPLAASKESQEYVKVINEFLTGAKDTFGSRVSNFETGTFLKRLPTLINSQEGRTAVFEQMKIINEINRLENNTVKKVVQRHGGIRKIDLDRAHAIAEKEIEPKIEKLRKEYVKKEDSIQKILNESSSKINKSKEVIMTDPQGNRRAVPKSEAKAAQAAGYKLAK